MNTMENAQKKLASEMRGKWYAKIEDTLRLYLHTAKACGCEYDTTTEIIQAARLKTIADYEDKIRMCNKIAG